LKEEYECKVEEMKKEKEERKRRKKRIRYLSNATGINQAKNVKR
jgi:hypothetical protein